MTAPQFRIPHTAVDVADSESVGTFQYSGAQRRN